MTAIIGTFAQDLGICLLGIAALMVLYDVAVGVITSVRTGRRDRALDRRIGDKELAREIRKHTRGGRWS